MDKSSGDVLSSMQQISEQLLQTCLNCPVGAAQEIVLEEKQESFTDLYMQYRRLDQLVHQRTVLLKTENSLHKQPVKSTDDLKSSIGTLQDRLLDVSTEQKIRDHLIPELQMGVTLNDVLFSESTCSLEYGEDIKRLVNHHVQLTAAVRTELKKSYILSHKLDKLRAENSEKVEIGRRLKTGLDEIRHVKQKSFSSKVTSETVNKYKDECQETIKHIILVRNIYKGLIIASGTDWAMDEELTATLQQLGDSLDNQIAPYMETQDTSSE